MTARVQKTDRVNAASAALLARIDLAVLAVAGLLLVWLILTRTYAAYLAEADPAAALWLQPREPRALLHLAQEAFKPAVADEGPEEAEQREVLDQPDRDRFAAPSRMAETAMTSQPDAEAAADPDGAEEAAEKPERPAPSIQPAGKLDAATAQAVRDLARRALAAGPLNAEALVLLGRVAERTDDAENRHTVEPLMRAAARLSVRRSYAVYWLMRQADRDGRADEVARLASDLLGTRPQTLRLVMPSLHRLAADPATRPLLVGMLESNPPWRAAFFNAFNASITDARTPLHVLSALNETEHPPKASELAAYINFLLKKDFHELAYYTWLQFQPPDELVRLRPLTNGSFEKPLSGLPFDWTLPSAGSAIAEIRSSGTQHNQALFIAFTQGRAAFAGVQQITLAPPGTYTLRGRHQGRLVGTRGLSWKVSCVGEQQLLGQSAAFIGDVPQWRDFSFSFTIPEGGCRAQKVRLELDARSASEKLVSGSMWFDDLELARGGG